LKVKESVLELIQNYTVERRLTLQTTIEEQPHLRRLTRRQRGVLAGGTGIISRRRQSTAALARRHLAAYAALTSGTSCVEWGDNFNRLQFARNPHEERQLVINGTVRAGYALDFSLVASAPVTFGDLIRRIDDVSQLAVREFAKLVDSVRTRLLQTPSIDEYRVPCDIRRRACVAAPWYPLGIIEANISSGEGLVEWMRIVQAEQSRRGSPRALLMDVNPYYRLQKCLWSETYVELNIAAALRPFPLVFGLWHIYVHCLRSTYQLFLPYWAALAIPGLIDGSDLPESIITHFISQARSYGSERYSIQVYAGTCVKIE
jgi:hypothetical protein